MQRSGVVVVYYNNWAGDTPLDNALPVDIPRRALLHHIAAVESAFPAACAGCAVGMSLSSRLPVDLLSERAIEIEGGAD
jgi:hypothetical protein